MRKNQAAYLAATVLTVIGSPAFAQVDVSTPRPVDPGAGNQTQVSDQAAVSSDIIVTAQRRSERLVDVPIAITTVTAAQLDTGAITTLTDLDRLAPGLLFPSTGPQAQPTIRGVGTFLTGPGVESNVAIYIDGVYQANQGSNFFDLSNIQQIEVLKGPQGTLFGRNATGGAITVQTIEPSFEPAARFKASFGTFRDVRLNGYANIPLIGDVVALNVAGFYRQERGHRINLFNNQRVDGVEARALNPKLLIAPSPELKIVLSGTYSNRNDDKLIVFNPYQGQVDAYVVNAGNPAFRLPGPSDINQDTTPIFRTRLRSVNGRVEYDTGVGTLTSLTAYTKFTARLASDLDQSPLGGVPGAIVPPGTGGFSGVSFSLDEDKAFSQELDFASEKFGALSFVAGLFYYDQKASRDQSIIARPSGALVNRAIATVKTRAYAVFGEANFDITDTLHLIAGLRYSNERKRPNAFRTVGGGIPLNASQTYDAFTPRVSVRYELDRSTNIYATYSKGFKSGLFNSIQLDPRPVRPEDIDAFEVGFKTSQQRFRANLSAFYYKYADIQVNAQVFAGMPFLTNAAKAEIKGIDLDFDVDLTSEFSISGGAAYTDSKFEEFNGALLSSISPVTRLGSITFGSAAGNTLPRAPKFQANLSADYGHVFTSGKLGLNVSGSYNSGYFAQADNRLKAPSYVLLNGEVSWITPDDRFKLSIWGKNLTDEIKPLSLQSSTRDIVIWDEPRTVGVAFAINFLP